MDSEIDEILMDDVLEVTSPEQEPLNDVEDDVDVAAEPNPVTREKPREEQLDYPQSLPYETESLATMDARSVRSDWRCCVRSLIVCIF